MTVTVHLPDELAARLRAAAASRGIGIDDVTAEFVAAGLDAAQTTDHRSPQAEAALAAFVGMIDSGATEPFDIHAERKKMGAQPLRDRR